MTPNILTETRHHQTQTKTIKLFLPGTKSFLVWLIAVVATIYVIDSYILTRDRLEYFVQGMSVLVNQS